jgi:hypothetical protein
VRRLFVLLVAAGLLALHHGVPMAMEQGAMSMGKGAMPTSSGPMVVCVGVLAAAVALRRVGALLFVRRQLDWVGTTRVGHPALSPPDARDRPPPRPPTLSSLCVSRR